MEPLGQEVGDALDKSPAHLRANIQNQTAIHTKGQFRASPIPNNACLWSVGGHRTTLWGGDSATPFFKEHMK